MAERNSTTTRYPTRTEIAAEVYRAIAAATGTDITLCSEDSTLAELGVDLFDCMELVMDIERTFSVTMPWIAVERAESVSDLIDVVAACMRASTVRM